MTLRGTPVSICLLCLQGGVSPVCVAESRFCLLMGDLPFPQCGVAWSLQEKSGGAILHDVSGMLIVQSSGAPRPGDAY